MSNQAFKAPELEHLTELLPAYEFEAFIAQGGMGAVYKAVQRSLDREVAIKILPREFGADPGFRSCFETEAKAMARLNHPNLIGVYDFGDVDGMPYIVMEFVNGKSLYHSSWNSIVEPTQAIQIVRGICEGLAHAHENGVIHRDIKPANILLTPKAEPKIGDFGLAQPAGDNDSGLVMGTPGYVAPEVLKLPHHADKRSDIFAVGIILHGLLTGQWPDSAGKFVPVLTGKPSLDAIWQKAIHPEPALRYQDVTHMLRDLASWSPARQVSPPKAIAASSKPGQTALGINAGAHRRSLPTRAPLPGKSPPAKVAPKSHLPRNLFIIVGLVAAIAFTRNALNDPKPKPVVTISLQEQQTSEFERQETDEIAAQPEALAAAAVVKSATLDPEPKTLIEEREAVLESLDRTRTALEESDRNEGSLGNPTADAASGSASNGVLEDASTEVPERFIQSVFEEVLWTGSWQQAKADAEAKGGRLAILDHPSKQHEVERLKLSGFIGAREENESGEWRWINGEPLTHGNWALSQPDRSDQEFLYVQNDGKWDDRSGQEGDRYILEKMILTGHVGEKFKEITNQWKAQIDQALAPLVALEANYTAALGREREKAQRSGNLDLVLAIDAEIEQLGIEGRKAPLELELIQLYQIYEKHRILEIAKATPAVGKANQKHFAEMRAMMEELTKSGLLEEALLVEAERERRMNQQSDQITSKRPSFQERITNTTWKWWNHEKITFLPNGRARWSENGEEAFTWQVEGVSDFRISGKDQKGRSYYITFADSLDNGRIEVGDSVRETKIILDK